MHAVTERTCTLLSAAIVAFVGGGGQLGEANFVVTRPCHDLRATRQIICDMSYDKTDRVFHLPRSTHEQAITASGLRTRVSLRLHAR